VADPFPAIFPTYSYFFLYIGFVLHAGMLYFFGFWLFHLAHLLFALAFPLKAKKFMEEHSKVSHIVEVIIVLIVGSLPGAVIIGTSQYQINRFPPEVCISNDYSVFFHSFALPIAIGASIGLCMLFTAFWVLRRVSYLWFVPYTCLFGDNSVIIYNNTNLLKSLG